MDDTGSVTRRKRKHRHRFYVSASRFKYPANGLPSVIIDPDTGHHMREVLRLGSGAVVVLFDNSGQEYEGEIIESKPSKVVVQLSSKMTPKVESPVRINLAQSLLKGNAFDRVLTLCTELGAVGFAPLFTSRTMVKLTKAQTADKVPRWEKIVAEASAQCGRVKLPAVGMPMDLKEYLEKKREGTKIILWEKAGSGQINQILEDVDKTEPVTLLAGPEGGFAQAEVKQAIDAGFCVWGLGPRTMRAETSGAIAIGLLQYMLGDMG